MAAQQQQHQHHRERDAMMIDKHGKVRTKVAGDDEMLRTGFHNGTPLEAGKIAADSEPVDLFAPAHRLAHQQADHNAASGQSQQHLEEDDHPAPPPPQQQGRQGMAEHAAGGRRLGRQA